MEQGDCHPRRFLVVAYEFADPIFSGNGTYGRTVVEALCLATCNQSPPSSTHNRCHADDAHRIDDGDNARALCVVVDVVCGVPARSDPDHTVVKAPALIVPFYFQSLNPAEAQINILPVPLSDARWRCHDLKSDWMAFAEGAAARYGALLRSRCCITPQAPVGDDDSGGVCYDAVIAIDWHGACALQRVLGGWQCLAALRDGATSVVDVARGVGARNVPPPFTYLNFRVFGNPLVMGGGDGPDEQRDLKTLMAMESAALLCSRRTVVLCSADASMLRDNAASMLCDEDGWLARLAASTDGSDGSGPSSAMVAEAALFLRDQQGKDTMMVAHRTAVVLPPVRTEVLALAREAEKDVKAFIEQHIHPDIRRMLASTGHPPATGPPVQQEVGRRQPATPGVATDVRGDAADGVTVVSSTVDPQRRLITCCVRQARDKNPQRFVSLVEELMSVGDGGGMPEDCVPVFFGAAPDPDFSLELRERLRRACPRAVCITDFVTPAQLVATFFLTRLNVHPSLYDAYGLTIVEAAVCGCPTAIHKARDALRSPVGVVDLLAPHRTLPPTLGNDEATATDAASSSSTLAASSSCDVRCDDQRAFFVDFRDDDAPATCEAAASLQRADAAQCVADVLRDAPRRDRVATAACAVARGYDTAACGAMLLGQLMLPTSFDRRGKCCVPRFA